MTKVIARGEINAGLSMRRLWHVPRKMGMTIVAASVSKDPQSMLTINKCIRKWRDPLGKGPDISNLKKCPMCRVQCRYIIPSSRFVKDGLEKERVIQNYKDSMARVPCQHFVTTKAKNAENPLCPYGADCFYQHLNDDGTAYVFPYGAEFALRVSDLVNSISDVYLSFMKDWTRRNRSRTRHSFNIPDGFQTIFGDETGLAGNFVMEMMGMLRQVMGSSVEEGGANAGRGSEGIRLRRRVPAMDFLSSLYALRAELLGDDNDGVNIRPAIFAEAIASPHSASQSDRESGGSGSTESVAGVENTDISFTESLRLSRDTETSVPPLEPINIPHQETPSLSLERLHVGSDSQDDDEMPALQSVSNSSDSEGDDDGGDDGPDEHFNHDPSDDLPPPERVVEPDEIPSFSRRFSTVVERDIERSEGETMEEEQPGPSYRSSASPVARDLEGSETSIMAQYVPTSEPTQSVVSPPPHPEPTLEPQFVTDGRGRVVWSNKDPTETTASSETREETRDDAPQSPSSAIRLFEWVTGFF
ncbi:hypothetical protein C0992_002644 [Termitomyces sp. T32_za158]|nr:hypothetical protein C0992_002644 [Termitomyces sp. T32_za158]